MHVTAWPFLVSRNQTIGYRVILAPDFMLEASVDGLLTSVVAGKEKETIVLYHLRKTPVGALTIACQTTYARGEHLGHRGYKEFLRDEHGRRISFIQGFVTRGLHEQLMITASHFQQAGQQIIPAYSEFWKTTQTTYARPSHSFLLTQNRKEVLLPQQSKQVVTAEASYVTSAPMRKRRKKRFLLRRMVVSVLKHISS